MQLKEYSNMLAPAVEAANTFEEFENNARWICNVYCIAMPDNTQMDFIWGKAKGLPVTDGRQKGTVTIGVGV